MKATTWALSVLAAALMVFTGTSCKKSAPAQQPQTLEEGVAQLRAALATSSAEVRSNLYSGVDYGVRYGNYVGAMMALDQIASDPSLSETQKKLANDVLALFKQRIQSQTNAAPPAH